MKKQLKDCTAEELIKIIDNPNVIHLMKLCEFWEKHDMTYADMEFLAGRIKELSKEEVELEDN